MLFKQAGVGDAAVFLCRGGRQGVIRAVNCLHGMKAAGLLGFAAGLILSAFFFSSFFGLKVRRGPAIPEPVGSVEIIRKGCGCNRGGQRQLQDVCCGSRLLL